MTPFLIALWGNVHALMIAVAFISGLTAIGLGTAWGMYSGEAQFGAAKDAANAAACKRFFKRAAIVASISCMVSAFPDVDDIWRARITLVKMELSSPENVQKGAEEIERIAQHLECKYLGCEEEKEKGK
jgi:hypothetical protein